jgi:hypothetical protein
MTLRGLKLTLLSVLAAATLFGWTGFASDLETYASSSGRVRVIDSTHRVEFPHRFVLNLEARAPSDIESTRVHYTIGDAPVSVYAYPTRLSHRGNLSAEFEVQTGRASFIPQGVDVEYYYSFTDTSGRTTYSERFSFEYLDPRYRWQRIGMGDFTLIWHDMPASSVRRVAANAAAQMSRVKRLFGVNEDQDFKVVIVNSRREANRSFPAVSQTSQDVSLYGGFAFSDYGAIVLSGLQRDSLIHELTHLMLHEAVDSPRARVPAWLNEGLAMYFESRGAYRESQVRDARRHGRLLPLRHMDTVPGRPSDVRLFYSQSASVVRYLMDDHGSTRMSRLLNLIDSGLDIDDALKQAYGFDVNGLDRAWKAQISGATQQTPWWLRGFWGRRN